MPGFLSQYEGTERVPLGGGYWVDVARCLTHEQMQKAQAKMGAGRQSVEMSGKQFMSIDMNAFQTELLVQSIRDWNLDDEQGEIWPLKPEPALRASVARLPATVARQVFEVCDRLNGSPDSTEAARFPDRAGGGDPDGEGGTSRAGVVPDPGGLLGPAGGNPGKPEDTPVA